VGLPVVPAKPKVEPAYERQPRVLEPRLGVVGVMSLNSMKIDLATVAADGALNRESLCSP
jgi:hypothetical protein